LSFASEVSRGSSVGSSNWSSFLIRATQSVGILC